ncbi:hypothetical protein SAMN05444287_0711 [Octadecabacter temperatus]|uniref:Uncharacterized protein n=1 Tax=Octadecabacter temperatus TaxID=1458307 RepID=A0A0K0Y3W1_9RHOB|nr:hypothetical protein [Octadecabacter temperatus]AKS45615.1 hypothetical protein OSB_10570 [Octadecabacter temperatus]SIN96885.1 hypothetical protein SAMN05444287_0711 [Octadecabacter temperatus]
MIDLFLPLVLGLGIGITPPEGKVDEVAEPEVVAEALPPVDLGSGDDLSAAREPEPQIPTGKYTTAIEIRPILGMTKTNWVGVREYEGQDLLYFSHLMAWRCGLWDIRYGINGEPADIVVPMEPCNEEFAQPNVMVDIENYLPYVVYPVGSIESVYVEIVFDDGTTDFGQFERNEVRIP